MRLSVGWAAEMPEEISNYRAIVNTFASNVTLTLDNNRVDEKRFGEKYACDYVRKAVAKAVDGITDRFDRENAAGDAAEDAVRRLLGSAIEGDGFPAMMFAQFLGGGNDAWREVGKRYLSQVDEGL